MTTAASRATGTAATSNSAISVMAITALADPTGGRSAYQLVIMLTSQRLGISWDPSRPITRYVASLASTPFPVRIIPSPPVPARPHEPGLVGDDHQLCPVSRPELYHGPADVGLSGGRADIEPSGDLGVGQSFPDEGDHLALPVGQLAEDTRGHGRLRAGGEFADQPPGNAGGEQGTPVGDHPHGLHELVRVGVLDQEPGGPGADRLEHVLVQLEGGQDHHPDVG